MLSPEPTPTSLLRRYRTPLLGLALGGAVVLLGWQQLQARLGREAIRQAAAGQSDAVAAVRSDWAASVIPAALTANGQAGEDARRVASVRIDLVVARARRGDTEPFVQLAEGTLAAIRGLKGLPTDAGARWAEWLAPRLVEAAEFLPFERRVTILAAADGTLHSLAVRPRRREDPPTVESSPLAPPAEIAATPPLPTVVPPPAPQEEPAEPKTTSPTTLAIRPVPSEPAPLAPSAWRPEWGAESKTTPPRAMAAEPVERSTDSESERSGDIQLLAKLVELAAAIPAEARATSARGPTKAPGRHQDQVATARRELAAVRNELARRGYRSITAAQVAALLSENAVDRITLAERLATDRSGDAVRLLLLLTKDASGEVRAAAIGVLASSANRGLIQMAADLASRDPDPRVGRLAASLRERLR